MKKHICLNLEEMGEKLGTFNSNFTLSAIECHQRGLNMKGRNSFLPCISFSNYYIAHNHPTQSSAYIYGS